MPGRRGGGGRRGGRARDRLARACAVWDQAAAVLLSPSGGCVMRLVDDGMCSCCEMCGCADDWLFEWPCILAKPFKQRPLQAAVAAGVGPAQPYLTALRLVDQGRAQATGAWVATALAQGSSSSSSRSSSGGAAPATPQRLSPALGVPGSPWLKGLSSMATGLLLRPMVFGGVVDESENRALARALGAWLQQTPDDAQARLVLAFAQAQLERDPALLESRLSDELIAALPPQLRPGAFAARANLRLRMSIDDVAGGLADAEAAFALAPGDPDMLWLRAYARKQQHSQEMSQTRVYVAGVATDTRRCRQLAGELRAFLAAAPAGHPMRPHALYHIADLQNKEALCSVMSALARGPMCPPPAAEVHRLLDLAARTREAGLQEEAALAACFRPLYADTRDDLPGLMANTRQLLAMAQVARADAQQQARWSGPWAMEAALLQAPDPSGANGFGFVAPQLMMGAPAPRPPPPAPPPWPGAAGAAARRGRGGGSGAGWRG